MSDRIEDVVKSCKDVFDGLYPPRKQQYGLFPIPEYPEFTKTKSGMWAAAFETILTTLRYLAPATLLTIFWGHHSYFFSLLKCIDRAIRSIIFSSNEQKESVLRWLNETGHVQVENLETVWKNGWLLCGILDSLLPGACPGHPPSKLSLKHAQTLAQQYLGVNPVFTDKELDSIDSLTSQQEWRLAYYLDKIREAIKHIPPPVSKPNSQRTSPDSSLVTLDYAARGLGLNAAQVNNKMHFKIYPTCQQSLDPADITILIKGPNDTFGITVLPPILGKAQKIRQTMLNLQNETQFTQNKLPTTIGTTYLRNYGRNDMTKTYHIPKSKNDIEIEVEPRSDHVNIKYVVNLEGMYEISISSNGQNIVGSPFLVTASHSILGALEQESFCLEDGEQVDIVDVQNDRKVVLRIVDFITEKMLLREDGVLEKISDEDANDLMITAENHLEPENNSYENENKLALFLHKLRFKDVAIKVALLVRICKIFASNVFESKKSFKLKRRPMKQQHLGIPDIVNSTLNDASVRENRKRVNVKSTASQVEKQRRFYENISNSQSTEKWFELKDIVEDLEDFSKEEISASNPFFNELKDIKLNRSKNDSVMPHEIMPFRIEVESETPRCASPNTQNPFIQPELLERPKTPVLKIITGDLQNREDSVFVDPSNENIITEIFGSNEVMNPFFSHRYQEGPEITKKLTDFKIGAPVSTAAIKRPLTPETNLDSLIFTSNNYLAVNDLDKLGTSASKFDSVDFVSLESNESEEMMELRFSDDVKGSKHSCGNENHPSKRDLWDSAYVSIDENNSSPEAINSSSITNKGNINRFEDFCKLGPAEKELWNTCEDLGEVTTIPREHEISRWESKRLVFTPIIEESERSMSTVIKDSFELESSSHIKIMNCKKLALTEQNEILQDLSLSSGQSSVNYEDQDKSIPSLVVYNSKKLTSVDSASEGKSDVKRQTITKPEGMISEVQFNATESTSASPNLRHNNTNSTLSEEDRLANIVWEKKKFWDEKIRQIKEIESSEKPMKKSPKKTHEHNTAFTTEMQVLNKTTMVTEINKQKNVNKDTQSYQSVQLETNTADEKLVDKWKKFWDEKLEQEQHELHSDGTRSKSPKYKETSPLRTLDYTPLVSNLKEDEPLSFRPEHANFNVPLKLVTVTQEKNLPSESFSSDTYDFARAKQGAPEEIIFQAFETSPKRFFGTSRKQILSKINSFLGKQAISTQSTKDAFGASSDKELVSNRVSLFHSISREETTCNTFKSKSMSNIHQVALMDDKRKSFKLDVLQKKNASECKVEGTSDDYKTLAIMDPEKHGTITTEKHQCTSSHDKSRAVKFENNIKKCSKDKINSSPDKIESKLLTNLNSSITQNISEKHQSIGKLKKSTFCKSELDIFAKYHKYEQEDPLDRYKSCEDLPKINVKSFITLYEKASSNPKKSDNTSERLNCDDVDDVFEIKEHSDALKDNSTSKHNEIRSEVIVCPGYVQSLSASKPHALPRTKRISKNDNKEYLGEISDKLELKGACKKTEVFPLKNDLREQTFEIISDIEVIENPDIIAEKEKQQERNPDDYRLRFKSAKQFFQSIEELSPKSINRIKMNECEELLRARNHESQNIKTAELEELIFKKEKSHSVPSPEHKEVWNQVKEIQQNSDSDKLVKISEKFQVDDLFEDVIEGKLSRQGSLRGIPNKKAVLETFKSMENIASKLSPYELTSSKRYHVSNEGKNKNAQSFMTEYPYLPVTEPSKYQSRIDAKANGLLTMKELVENKSRRNSVPNFISNPNLAVN